MDFLEKARDRYSVRKYKVTPVEQEKIDKILQAAMLAPTARNIQPQRIFVVQSEEKRKALAQVTPCTFDAPVIFVLGFEREVTSKGKIHPTHDFGDTDVAIVGTHMMLEAHELGLGSCWVGNFVEKDVAAVLGIPDTIAIRDLLPVGYAAEDSVPSAMHEKSRELSSVVTYL